MPSVLIYFVQTSIDFFRNVSHHKDDDSDDDPDEDGSDEEPPPPKKTRKKAGEAGKESTATGNLTAAELMSKIKSLTGKGSSVKPTSSTTFFPRKKKDDDEDADSHD